MNRQQSGQQRPDRPDPGRQGGREIQQGSEDLLERGQDFQEEPMDPQDLQDLGPFDEPTGQQGGQEKPGGQQGG